MVELNQFFYVVVDKSKIRIEWKKWLRSLELYLAAQDVIDVMKKALLLHLGSAQLQKVAYKSTSLETLVQAVKRFFKC